MAFIKARFNSTKHGPTAGLVFEADKLRTMNIQEFSRFFPASEAMKMTRVDVSPEYPTWEEAFAHDFDSEVSK